jgi:DNA processing protein
MTSRPVSAFDLVAGEREHELCATVALLRASKLDKQHLGAVIDHAGSAVRLAQATDERSSPRLFPAVGGRIGAEEVTHALRDLQAWQARGLDVRTVLDPDYPFLLHEIHNRPALVFVQGRWDEARDHRAVAVVGSRRASDVGKLRARRLTQELVDAGFTIVSGLALGIDSEAHATALRHGGRTVAVLGSGLDHLYPPSNRELAREIVASGGALVSQFFPHQTPARWTFPLRNIVISGLSLATVVVEAGETSGARMQARFALEHGRTVFLPRALVETHAWARQMVEQGAFDTRAIVVGSAGEIVARLDVSPDLPESLAI